MNKKILITSLFATLMLFVPMTSVVGISDVSLNRKIEKIEDNDTITETYDNEDCGCQVVNRSNQVTSFICNILDIIFNNVQKMCDYFHEKANESWEAGYVILESLYLSLLLLCVGISMNIWRIGINLGCWEYQ
jgi:hypothetical protein